MAELAGINLSDFLEEGKGAGGNQTQGGKGKSKVRFLRMKMTTDRRDDRI